MPTLYYRVESPGINILDVVTQEAVDGFLAELHLTNLFTDSVYIMNSFRASSQYADKQGLPALVKNRCDVQTNYIMDKSQVPWPNDSPYTTSAYGMRSSNMGNHTPILSDPKAGVFIEHMTVACGVEMIFTLTFSNFDDACRSFDTIQSRYKGSLAPTPFDLVFAYPVTTSLYQFLYAVWKAKTDYRDKSLLDYIADHKKTEISFDLRKSQLTKPDADKELMVRCQQLRCASQFSCDQKEPEVNREDNLPDTYTVSFNLTLQFGRPDTIIVNTPVSVDNTLLPAEFFQQGQQTYHYSPLVSGIYQDVMCNEWMRRSFGNYHSTQAITRVPIYDTWFYTDAKYKFYEYRPFLVQHFTLDGPLTTISLKQLGGIKLHPVVVEMLGVMGEKALGYGGLFTLGVYAGDIQLDPVLLTLDNDLTLTIRSDRPDKEYHLVLSESTNIRKMSADWDKLLIKYRYFFPVTIERNLEYLIKNRYFYLAYDNSLLSLIIKLSNANKLKALLKIMVADGEDTNEIFSYTQNASQLADYLAYTQSKRVDYQISQGDDPVSLLIQRYYQEKVSVQGRSLLVAFLEKCLINGYVSLDGLPDQSIQPNRDRFPYVNFRGGTYGFNTPIRVIGYCVEPTSR